MSVSLIKVLPEVSTTTIAEVGSIVDQGILSAVKENKVAKVKAALSISTSPNRAWSLGGRID